MASRERRKEGAAVAARVTREPWPWLDDLHRWGRANTVPEAQDFWDEYEPLPIYLRKDGRR
jgi:hypothetical protein